MVIETQSGILTVAQPWWSVIRVEPEHKKTVILQKTDSEQFLVVAKYSTNKKAVSLYKAVNQALEYNVKKFSVKDWEAKYSESESSNN